ncbi:MAG: hypothetical protein GOP50_05345 [Candidatus Heimdallarchaeota archaeon]|nr:hypothetical protein [Candidatus Heimdallarchaeota archaeon]
MKKLLNKLTFFLIALFVFNLSISPTHAQATSITFRDMDIELDDVNNYGGVRVVVFFSHTCQVCKEEVATLKQIDNDYNISIFMLNYFQASENDTIVDFIDEANAPDHWIYGFMTDGTIIGFNIVSVPVTVVLDELGRIVGDMVGAVSYRFLESVVINAIEQNTDEYFTERREDPGSNLDVIFIAVGVIISAVVVYFLVQSIPPRKKKEEQE